MRRAAEAGMAALADFRRRAVGSACLELESDRLRALLREWLDVESQRGEFVVAAREKRGEVTLEQLRLSLRVDRIDTLADGSQVIIDYKTGSARIADWLGVRPPQRPRSLLYGFGSPNRRRHSPSRRCARGNVNT
ncbi:MAG: PD-(D/E)XK nuclease family protein [Halioglobus sp.]|nr:PD-(D/E)XK nuclease family protein [Halioglobus sp.]